MSNSRWTKQKSVALINCGAIAQNHYCGIHCAIATALEFQCLHLHRLDNHCAVRAGYQPDEGECVLISVTLLSDGQGKSVFDCAKNDWIRGLLT